jgi:hypothetical protein
LFQETDPDFDHCAVCIESYKQNDVVRVLPCKYVGFLCLKGMVLMFPFQSEYLLAPGKLPDQAKDQMLIMEGLGQL